MDSFKKETKKKELGVYYYWILDIPLIPQYLLIWSQNEGGEEGVGFDSSESIDRPKMVGEEGMTMDH